MHPLQAVGLLLFGPTERFLVLREEHSKPILQKMSGMLTFPLETMEASESRTEALSRLVSEEIGVRLHTSFAHLGDFTITYTSCHALMHIYTAHVDAEFIATPADPDVSHHGWLTASDLLQVTHKRIEVAPVLCAYLKHS